MRKLALAGCISLAVVADCGESDPRSPGTLRASTRPSPVRPAKVPTRVRPVAAGSTVGLPRVTSTENGRFGASVALSADSKTALIGEDGDNAAWVFESEP